MRALDDTLPSVPAVPPRPMLAAVPGVRTLASPRFRLVLATTLAVLGGVILGAAMLRQASQPAGQFGIDFGAYHGAARAMLDSGHPYAAAMLAGPVDAQGVGQYLYPPPLAQLLVPMAGLPVGIAAAAWFVLQAGAMLAAVWLALGAAGVPRHAERAAWSVVACLAFMPVFDTLWKGNVSGFVALTVSLVAMGGRSSGVAATAGTMLKVVPGVFLPLLLPAGRRAVVAALVTGVLIGGLSLFLHPGAWADYAVVLPNLVAGSSDYATNLAPAAIVERAGIGSPLPGLLRAGTIVAACLFMVTAPLVAWRRPGFAGRAAGTTLAAAAMLLLPAAAWYHYLTALLPVAALAWPAASMRVRVALLASATLVVAGVAVLPVATLGAGLLVALALAVQLRSRPPDHAMGARAAGAAATYHARHA